MSRPVVAERHPLTERSAPLPEYIEPARRSALRRARIARMEAELGLPLTRWADQPVDDEVGE